MTQLATMKAPRHFATIITTGATGSTRCHTPCNNVEVVVEYRFTTPQRIGGKLRGDTTRGFQR